MVTLIATDSYGVIGIENRNQHAFTSHNHFAVFILVRN